MCSFIVSNICSLYSLHDFNMDLNDAVNVIKFQVGDYPERDPFEEDEI